MDPNRRRLLALLLPSAFVDAAPAAKRKKPATTQAAAVPLSWKPRPLFNGAPILFTSTKPLEGPATWMGKPLAFRKEHDKWTALAGVDLDTKPGRYPLVLNGETHKIAVISRPYRVARITVAPEFVKPPKEVETRIDAEREFKKKVFAASPAERLWHGRFAAPTSTGQTSPFGTRRTYNGNTRSIHQGLDFAAATGTPIHAANSGRAVIARDMYFEGGLVVIDHGDSLFTLYMHLSEFLVKEGALVEKGQPIAKSGASGRVTGPHLHFGVQWQGSYLEPATLLRWTTA